MAIRDAEELGSLLVKITKRLILNQNLCKLLRYTDKNPLSHEDFENPKQLLDTNIRVIPKVSNDENTQSRLVLLIEEGNLVENNTDFRNIILTIVIYVPIEEWKINDDALRPFKIISEIHKSLKNKEVGGIGKLTGGNFKLDLLTDEMSSYIMGFDINVFD